jgi:hypothetical protein
VFAGNYSGSQESEFRSQNERTGEDILAKDLDYGDVAELRPLLEEVSKLLDAYLRAILNSDS